MTHCFALERLGCDGLDWDAHRHRPALRCVGILQTHGIREKGSIWKVVQKKNV